MNPLEVQELDTRREPLNKFFGARQAFAKAQYPDAAHIVLVIQARQEARTYCTCLYMLSTSFFADQRITVYLCFKLTSRPCASWSLD